MITVISKLFFFSVTHKSQIVLSAAHGYFFHCFTLFQDFLPNQTHIAKSLSDF